MEELQQALEALIADRDRWRTIAEEAITQLENAVKMLEALNGAPHD